MDRHENTKALIEVLHTTHCSGSKAPQPMAVAPYLLKSVSLLHFARSRDMHCWATVE